jgi:hypothetical protein
MGLSLQIVLSGLACLDFREKKHHSSYQVNCKYELGGIFINFSARKKYFFKSIFMRICSLYGRDS